MKRALSVLLLLFFLSQDLFASHAMGVDLTWTHVSGNTYEFTLIFYRDCSGIAAPASVTLNINPGATCGGAAASVTLNQVGTGSEVSPLCPSQILNSTCNGGTLPGVEQYTYRGQYTFTTQCSDWNVSFTHCCRNSMITNLSSPASYDIYVHGVLDNTGTLNNSSPSFTSLPVPYICSGQLFCYNHGAVDPDGDSLVYSLVNPLDGPYPGTNIPYVAPYTPTYPITDISSSVSFDSQTGSMCVTPNGAQVCVVTILVEEYRNGVKIGSTMRDLQIVVQNCTNQQPNMSSGGITNQTGGVQIDSNSVEICPGEFLSFDLVFTDPNALDLVTVTSNVASAIPGATFTTLGTNPVTGTFTWTPTPGDVGFHSFTVTVQDNGCPILGSQVYSFDINVLQGTWAGPDLNYCPAGGPVTIAASGGTSFNWNVLSGDNSSLSCTNCAAPQASPSVTTVYEVISNLSATCKNRDTVTVNVVPDFILGMSPDTTICRYGLTTLTASASPSGQAPFSYNWYPSDSLSSTTTASTNANPYNTTTYYCDVTSSAGCTITDSVTVTINGVAPQVVVSGVPDTICPGTSSQLTTLVYQDCGLTNQACSGPTQTGNAGTGTSATTTYSPHYMSANPNGYSHRKQFIYTRAELDAMGFAGGGKITAIALEYTTANNTANGITIKMGCSADDQFPTTSFVNGLDVVKSSFNWNISVGYNWVTLDNPYMWDGQSNLIVEFCTDNINSGTSSSVRYGCYTGYYRCLYTNQYNIAGACSYATGTRTTCRPNMSFEFCQALPSGLSYTWSPATGLSSTTIPNPTASPSQTTTYTVSVEDGSCVGGSQQTIAIDSSVYVSATSSNYTPCVGDVINLDALVTGSALPPSLPSCGTNSTACTQTVYSQTYGSGTSSSSTYYPFYGSYTDVHYQFLFLASDLQAYGMNSGTITQLIFDLGYKNSTSAFQGFTIRMGCTSNTSLSTSTGWLPTQLVWGPTNYSTVLGTNTFNLTNSFDWDGSSNIVIEFCFNNPDASTPGSTDYGTYTSVPYAGTMRYYTSTAGSNGCTLAPSYTYNYVPNIRFTVCPPPPSAFTYSWSPATGLSSPTVSSPNLTYNGSDNTYVVTVSGGLCTVTDTVNLTSCAPLPFSKPEIFAEREGNRVKVNWKMTDENGITTYRVERSYSPSYMNHLTKQSPDGSGSYTAWDERPYIGTNYYRVIATDVAGNQRASEIVSVKFDEKEGFAGIYPNPLKNNQELKLVYHSLEGGVLHVQISDVTGRIIYQNEIQVDAGRNELPVKVSTGAGIYLVTVKGNFATETRKLIITD